MTIPFGRRRLTLTVSLTKAPQVCWDTQIPAGADDRELAYYSRIDAHDIDRARWEALALMYGGVRRP
jgi:hypothetical protein